MIFFFWAVSFGLNQIIPVFSISSWVRDQTMGHYTSYPFNSSQHPSFVCIVRVPNVCKDIALGFTIPSLVRDQIIGNYTSYPFNFSQHPSFVCIARVSNLCKYIAPGFTISSLPCDQTMGKSTSCPFNILSMSFLWEGKKDDVQHESFNPISQGQLFFYYFCCCCCSLLFVSHWSFMHSNPAWLASSFSPSFVYEFIVLLLRSGFKRVPIAFLKSWVGGL